MNPTKLVRSLTLPLVLLSALPVIGADWLTYRGDAERSGYAAAALPTKLALQWKYQPLHPPTPAWPRDDRMLFDRASDVVVSNGGTAPKMGI